MGPLRDWAECTTELAWAAGFFDGEGSTSTRVDPRRPNAVRIQVAVAQASREPASVPLVLERFRRAVGGLGTMSSGYLDRRSGTYLFQWRADSFEESQAVIALLWRHLGPVKRAQAASVLRLYIEQLAVVKAKPPRPSPARPRRLAFPAVGRGAASVRRDLAWAAGLFDGEGSTEIWTRQHGRYTTLGIRSKVSQCDDVGIPDVLRRFREIIGRGWIEGPSSGDGYTNAYKWAAGAQDTLVAIHLLWPWLGEVKRRQALGAFSKIDDLPVARRHRWRDAALMYVRKHAATEASRA